MKNTIIALVVFFTTLCFSQESDSDLVKKTFQTYKSSILNNEGAEAANQVDKRTLGYYKDILEKTKTADSTEVEALGLLDKLMILTIRHRASKEDIMSFNGKELFIYAIRNGMVGKNSVQGLGIGEVKIDGDFAKAQILNNGQAVPLYFHFYKENGDWKIDLTSLFPASTDAFKNVVKQSGQSENQFILNVLGMLTGEKPNNTIWKSLN